MSVRDLSSWLVIGALVVAASSSALALFVFFALRVFAFFESQLALGAAPSAQHRRIYQGVLCSSCVAIAALSSGFSTVLVGAAAGWLLLGAGVGLTKEKSYREGVVEAMVLGAGFPGIDLGVGGIFASLLMAAPLALAGPAPTAASRLGAAVAFIPSLFVALAFLARASRWLVARGRVAQLRHLVWSPLAALSFGVLAATMTPLPMQSGSPCQGTWVDGGDEGSARLAARGLNGRVSLTHDTISLQRSDGTRTRILAEPFDSVALYREGEDAWCLDATLQGWDEIPVVPDPRLNRSAIRAELSRWYVGRSRVARFDSQGVRLDDGWGERARARLRPLNIVGPALAAAVALLALAVVVVNGSRGRAWLITAAAAVGQLLAAWIIRGID